MCLYDRNTLFQAEKHYVLLLETLCSCQGNYFYNMFIWLIMTLYVLYMTFIIII